MRLCAWFASSDDPHIVPDHNRNPFPVQSLHRSQGVLADALEWQGVNLEEYNETGVIILNVRSDGTNETKRVYTRGENSVLLKEEVFVNGVLTETTEYDYKTNGLIEKIQTKYDSEGRVSEIIEYNKKDNSAVHSRETFEYHENGKVKVHSVYGSDGKLKEKTEYDENGNVI